MPWYRRTWALAAGICVLLGGAASVATIVASFHGSGSPPETPPGPAGVADTPKAPPGGRTYVEIEGTLGAPTFANPSVSRPGSKIPPNAHVHVACKVYAPTIPSVSPKGYWYLISTRPWRNHYVAAANTFLNGGTLNGPGIHYVDARVPKCR